jgi:hypothetical protein
MSGELIDRTGWEEGMVLQDPSGWMYVVTISSAVDELTGGTTTTTNAKPFTQAQMDLRNGGGTAGAANAIASEANAIAAMNANINAWQAAIAEGTLNHTVAQAQFQAWFDVTQQQLIVEQNAVENAMTQFGLQQESDAQQLTAATALETATRERERLNAQRGISIQEERGRRAQSVVQHLLPKSVKGISGLNVPGLGYVPATPVDPDQLYDIEGLNKIPGIGTEVGDDLTNFTPTPLPNFPDSPTFDPSKAPTIPNAVLGGGF